MARFYKLVPTNHFLQDCNRYANGTNACIPYSFQPPTEYYMTHIDQNLKGGNQMLKTKNSIFLVKRSSRVFFVKYFIHS